MSSDENAVRALFLETVPTIVRSGEVPPYVALFDEHAIWCPNNAVERRGPEEIAIGYAAVVADTRYEPRPELIDHHVWGDEAFVFGHFHITITPASGPVTHARSRELWLLRKRHGTWKIWRMIWNIEPPPAT
jgi:ketosteroid isomerase-like protein